MIKFLKRRLEKFIIETIREKTIGTQLPIKDNDIFKNSLIANEPFLAEISLRAYAKAKRFNKVISR